MRKWVEIEGRRYRWKDLLKLRREQDKEDRKARQQPLFELHEDRRPASQQTADGRLQSPTLFKVD